MERAVWFFPFLLMRTSVPSTVPPPSWIRSAIGFENSGFGWWASVLRVPV